MRDDGLLLYDLPTPRELKEAEKNHKMILSFFEKPESVKDSVTAEAWLEGYLMALGIPRSSYHAVIFYPQGVSREQFIKHYIDNLNRSVNELELKRGVLLKGFSSNPPEDEL